MKKKDAEKIWAALRNGPFGDRLSDEVGLPGLYLVVGHRMQAKSTTLYDFCYNNSKEWAAAYDANGGLVADPDVDIEISDVKAAFRFGGEPEYATRFEKLYANILSCSRDIVYADSLRKMALTRVSVSVVPPYSTDAAAHEANRKQAEDKGLVPPNATLENLVRVSYTPTDQIWERGATAPMVEQLDYLNNQCLRSGHYCVATFNPLMSDSPSFRSMLEGSTLGIISLDGMSQTTYRTFDRLNHRVRVGALDAADKQVPEQWLRDPTVDDLYGKEVQNG